MKVGHRQDPIKESPIRKSRAFLRFELSTQRALFILEVGWVERSETQRVSELLVSKGKVELCGCLVQSHSKLTLFIL